jgi:peptidoglycan/xylan/chitin deacetylase (PgdA/CDA1 family)
MTKMIRRCMWRLIAAAFGILVVGSALAVPASAQFFEDRPWSYRPRHSPSPPPFVGHRWSPGPILPSLTGPSVQQPSDIDSRDFAMHKPARVINSVMSQLERRGKGIVLMHDFHRNTAEALPELIRQLKPRSPSDQTFHRI